MEAIINKHLINILKTNSSPIKSLSTRIVLNSSAVLLGCKPASTVMFNKSGCSSDMRILWDKYKEEIFNVAKLRYFELSHNHERVLVLVYDVKKLEIVIGGHDISIFLNHLGYDKNLSLIDKLCVLRHNYSHCIPHEIGVFLGLPLQDVLSYMGLTQLYYSCTMGWKMYGSTEASVSLYKHYRNCRNRIVEMLADNEDPIDILRTYPENHIM